MAGEEPFKTEPMRKIGDIIFFSMIITGLYAQSPILDAYVAEGLQNNLALRQKETNFLKSQQLLKQAHAMFLLPPPTSITS